MVAIETYCIGCRCEVWVLFVALVLAKDRCAAGEELLTGKRNLLLVASRDYSAAVLIVCVMLIGYYLVG